MNDSDEHLFLKSFPYVVCLSSNPLIKNILLSWINVFNWILNQAAKSFNGQELFIMMDNKGVIKHSEYQSQTCF